MLRMLCMFSTAVFVVTLAVGIPQLARSETPTDACTLLTQAQVGTVLGMQVGAGSGLVQHVCSWYAPGTSKGASLILYSPKRFEALRNLAAGYGVPKVSLDGVGDEATFGVIQNFATTLLVRKDTVVFMVRVEGLPDSAMSRETEAMAKSLAEEVLAKL